MITRNHAQALSALLLFLASGGCAAEEGDPAVPSEPASTGALGSTTSSGFDPDPTTGSTGSTGATADPPGTTTSVEPSGSSTTDSDGGDSSSGADTDSDGSSTGETDIDVPCEPGEREEACETPSPYEGAGECDPYAQDCADGERCVPFANDSSGVWNSTRCSPIWRTRSPSAW